MLFTGCGKKGNTVPEQINLKIIPFGKFSRTFNDMNAKHLDAARKIGITPVNSREEAIDLGNRLCQIKTCGQYKIDSLTHSIPFLVPEARDLLKKVGQNFIDSLESRGGGSYKIIVTSVLRAENDIKKLRQKNGNASSNSAHRYGTTFDIAYTRFERFDNKYEIPQAQLKHILAEVLLDLRKQDRCYIRYEVKQGCFHVTARQSY
nr:DUF5715 family protein [Coprobacter tertius]